MNTETPTSVDSTQKLSETADKLGGAVNQTWESTRAKAEEALQSGEKYVREHPGTSVLSLFGLGFLLGVLVGWSVAHEDEDEYSASARRFARRWGRNLNLD